MEARGIERQKREHDAKADEVDGDRRPNRPEPGRQRLAWGAGTHDLRQGGRQWWRQVGACAADGSPVGRAREEPPGSGSSLLSSPRLDGVDVRSLQALGT